MDLKHPNAAARADAVERVKRLQRHGPPPAGPVTAQASSSVSPLAPEAYTADDLFTGSTARRKKMPNGRWLWVHPLGLEQVVWLNAQATRHLSRLQLAPTDPARPVAYKALAWVYQVIACCRVGPEPDARPVFDIEHADALYRNPQPGSECIQQIVALCDELGKAGDGEGLSEGLRDFFGLIASWLAICALRLSTGSLETSRAALAEFASCVAAMRQRGTFSTADLDALPHVPLPAEKKVARTRGYRLRYRGRSRL